MFNLISNTRFLILGVVLVFVAGCAARSSNSRSETKRPKTALAETEVKRAVDEILLAYSRENVGEVIDRVSSDFFGNRTQFETRLDDQVQNVDSIDYDFFIERINPSDKQITVKFFWDRRWRTADTGNLTLSSGSAVFRFVKKDDELLLQNILGDNPFF